MYYGQVKSSNISHTCRILTQFTITLYVYKALCNLSGNMSVDPPLEQTETYFII